MKTSTDVKNVLLSQLDRLVEEPAVIAKQTKNKLFATDPIDEVLKEILRADPYADYTINLPENPVLNLTHELLNKFMLCINRAPVSESFYNYFFDNRAVGRRADTLDNFILCIDHFRKVAMLRYGSFKRAWDQLSTKDKLEDVLLDLESRSVGEIARSASKIPIQEIMDEDLFLLGYLTGDRPQELYDNCIKLLNDLINSKKESKASNGDILQDKDILYQLIENHTGTNLRRLSNLEKISEIKRCRSTIMKLKIICMERQKLARKTGLNNTYRYLTASKIDIYFSASMRGPMDFKEMHRFVSEVMNHPSLSRLKLNAFDPTMSYTTHPRSKGLVECLMLKRAKVNVYMAGEHDSLGKDCELATTLVQGKPAIAFVREGLDRRADIFQGKHPLSMQVDLNTGVAHGILVTRKPEDCARLLYDIFTNNLQFEIVDGEHKDTSDRNYYLIEKRTKSRYRMVSKDFLLTNCFWNWYFENNKKEETIIRLEKEFPKAIH